VVVPVSLSFVRAPAHPGYPGSKGCKTVVVVVVIFNCFCLCATCSIVVYTVCCSPEIPNIPHKAEVQSLFPKDKLEYLNFASSSDTFPKFAKLLSCSTYTYHIVLGLTVSAGGLTESLVRFLFDLFSYY